MSNTPNTIVAMENAPAADPLMEILARQREEVHKNRIPDFERRRERLNRLRALILDHRDKLVAAVNEDFGGRSPSETEILELIPVLSAIRHARGHLKKWMKPKGRPVDIIFWPSRAELRHEPLGVVGIISPWNYPVNLALSPLCDALAAGNRVMIKPSELTPRTAEVLKELIGQYYEQSEVAVITGGPDVAARFSSLPFDHLFFTGSTAVGRKVALAAAENLVPTTLELGGKSPAILCNDFSVEEAAKTLSFGKFINSGQTCIAPDYVLAPKDKVEPLAEALLAQARKRYPDLSDEDYSAIISERHLSRLKAMVEADKAGGARVMTSGEAPEGKMAPTVMTHLPDDAAIMKEEIFGPVLPILGYDTLEQAADIVHQHGHPLALYAFTKDAGARETILNELISGGVTINGTLAHIAQESLPFGGVGPSGWGAYHGDAGFERFSHARSVFRVRGLRSIELFGPPWKGLAKRATEILMRR